MFVRYSRYYFLLILLSLLDSSWAHSQRCQPQLENLSIAKDKVEAYYENGQYEHDTDVVVDEAIKYFSKVCNPSEKTVVFDIDDTALSTFNVAKAIYYGHINALTYKSEMGAHLPAIPATKRLYDFLVHKGFHIVFITGRFKDEYAPTVRNLKTEGFTHFDKVITRSPEEEKLTAQEYKTEQRIHLAQEGYKIAGSIGDQWSDLIGPYSGHHVKLPNYMYILR